MALCKVKDCSRTVFEKSYCRRHYLQQWRHGEIFSRTRFDPNEFVFKDNICEIILYDKKGIEKARAIIDAEDYLRCKSFKWCIGKGNVVCRAEHLYLHHLVYGESVILDHINRDWLDNRKANLRPCTILLNNVNSPPSCKNTSGYKGIYKRKDTGRWTAKVHKNRKGISLGCFDTLKEAITARNTAAKIMYGEFAYIQEPS